MESGLRPATLSVSLSLSVSLVFVVACGGGPEVRTGPAQLDVDHYVRIDISPSDDQVAAHSALFESTIRERVAAIEGVGVAPVGELDDVSEQTIAMSQATGHWLTGSYVLRSQRDGSVRVETNIVVATFPERAIRATLRGSARASGYEMVNQAIQGSVEGALRRFPPFLTAPVVPSVY